MDGQGSGRGQTVSGASGTEPALLCGFGCGLGRIWENNQRPFLQSDPVIKLPTAVSSLNRCPQGDITEGIQPFLCVAGQSTHWETTLL